MKYCLDFLLKYDVLSIPGNMASTFAVIKGCSISTLAIFFVIALLKRNIFIISGKQSDFKDLIISIVLIFCGFSLYDFIFLKIISLCEVFSMAVVDGKSVDDLLNFVADRSFSFFLASAGNTLVGKAVASLATLVAMLSPRMLILGLLSVLVSAAHPTILFVRYAFLCFLYLTGPIALVLAIFPDQRHILKGWFANLIQVSFWIVTLRIFELIMVQMGLQNMTDKAQIGDTLTWLIINIVFLIFFFLSAFITAKMFSGENLGSIGSLVITGASLAAGHIAVFHGSLIAKSASMAPGGAVLTHHTGNIIRNVVIGTKAIFKQGYSTFRRQPLGKKSDNDVPRR